MFIYKITNSINGKIYIGQTIEGIYDRWRKHVDWSTNHKSNTIFHKAIRKYGKESFLIEAICECDSKEQLNLAEIAFIHALSSLCPNGYNLTEGGEGYLPSAAARHNMSVSHQGYVMPEIQKEKIRKSLLGKKKSREHSRSISKAKKNVKFSESHKEALRLSHIGHKPSEDTKLKMKEAQLKRWEQIRKYSGA